MPDQAKASSGRSYHKPKTPRLTKKHKPSSARWLTRQLSDPYVAEARRLGYRSRAAMKLMAIDEKHRLFRPNQIVLDLGAAPGGWLQLVADRIGVGKPNSTAQLIGVDCLPIDPLPHVTLLQGDITDPATLAKIRALLPHGADWVLSDMAAPTTGHKQTDHRRTDALLESALALATQVLKPGGGFLAKCFAGGSDKARLTDLRAHFAKTRHIKPAASRKQSPELYILATPFHP